MLHYLFEYETYDISKTLIFGLVLVFVTLLGYLILQRMKIKIDKKFGLAIFPWVVLGSILRVLEDLKIVHGILFVTPFVWFLSFSLFFIFLLTFRFFEKKLGMSAFKLLFFTGIFTWLPFLPFLNFSNPIAGGLILSFFTPWLIIFYLIPWRTENKLVTLIHVLDSTVTYTAINFFGYTEKHFIPLFFIQKFTPFSFVFLKLFSIVLILIFLDKFVDQKNLNNYLKMCIGVLGTATASRDFLLILV